MRVTQRQYRELTQDFVDRCHQICVQINAKSCKWISADAVTGEYPENGY